MSSSRDQFILGLLAIQNGLINREQLVSAFSSWLADPSKPITDYFLDAKSLSRADVKLLELLAERIEFKEQWIEQTATSIPEAELVAKDLEDVARQDAELTQSLVTILQATQQLWKSESIVTASPSNGDATGQKIGPYKLLQPIGSGGMGTVWMAEQEQPVKRQVAVKLIKPFVGSKEVIARFEAERQALAMMNHPNIARMLDVGRTDNGQPFFVMELVEGQTLTSYCDRNKLSIDERLKLFIDICHGVQHAHQKGIIHRDLKPSNVLVAIHDGVAVPKIIDFGLAKAMETTQRLTDQSLFTEIGQVLGTLKYMSPEQASLDNLDIDTRADIYAMGVILYELLTGSTPLEDSSIKRLAALQVLEFIRDKEPLKPSSKLASSTDQQLSSITGQRQTDSVQLKRILLGDLDWIVMKALEKERSRRYESASGFAEDIRRYLDSEPVNARPPSLNYRLRKFVRKNRAGVFAASLVTLVLIGGIVGTTTAMFRALGAEKIAGEQRGIADEQREIADARRQQAEANEKSAREQSQLALSTLTSVVNDLQGGLRDVPGGGEIRRRLLTTSLEKLQSVSTQFLEQSAVDRSTWQALTDMGDVILTFGTGEAGSGITEPKSELLAEQKSAVTLAESYYRRAFEIAKTLVEADPNDAQKQRDLSVSYYMLGDVFLNIGRTEAALAQYEHGLKIRRALAEADPDDFQKQRDLSISFERLGDVFLRLGRTEEVLDQYEHCLKIRRALADTDPSDAQKQRDLANALQRLGNVFQKLGRTDEALARYEDGLEIRRGLAEADPSDAKKQREMSNSVSKLGDIYLTLGRTDDALAQYKDSVKISRSLAEADPNDLQKQANLSSFQSLLGDVFRNLGRTGEALAQYEDSLKIRRFLAEADPRNVEKQRDLSTTFERIGIIFEKLGKPEEALKQYQAMFEIKKSLAHADVSNTISQSELSIALGHLGDVYRTLGRMEDALAQFEDRMEVVRDLADADPSDVEMQLALSSSHGMLGDMYLTLNRASDAVAPFECGLKIVRELVEVDPSNSEKQHVLSVFYNKLGEAFLTLGRMDDALAQFQDSLKTCRSLAEADHHDAQKQRYWSISCLRLGDMFLTLGRTDDALAQYEDSLAISLALAEADPQHVEKQSDLIYIYYKIAQAETNRDRFETAEKNLRSAILIYDQMIANKQNLPTANQGKTFMEGQLQAMQSLRLALGDWETVLKSPVDDLPGLLDYRAIQCCQRKRFGDAEQAADKLCELAQATDGNLYNAACVYALCAMAIASPEDSELAADDKSRKEILLAKSVGALQKAVDKGWTDFDHMRQDSDLAPLRELPEFKALFPADQ